MLHLFQMRDMRHDNINQFIGASIESERVLIVTQYALRGSLEVSIRSQSICLTFMFKIVIKYYIFRDKIVSVIFVCNIQFN